MDKNENKGSWLNVMAWIESHTVLLRHRKLRELAKDLRLKPVHAMGHLHALWHAALEQQEDGDLSKWSDEFIADQADFSGDAPQFVRLLQSHGWLDGKVIHDWLDYAGLFLTRKYSTSGKKRLADIWALHGKRYGEVNGKRAVSEQLLLAPHLTNQPNQPHPPPEADVGATSSKESADAAAFASASTFARNWISANCPSFLRSGVSPFTRLVQRLGKAEAAKQIEQAMAKPDVGNPFSWLEAKLDKQSASKSAVESAQPPRLTKARIFGDA